MGIKDYILVTPCKNEEESLPKLAESVVNQTIKPILWVIVDDGSTDRTPEILRNITSKHSWIKSLRLNEKPRDLGIHLSHVYRTGFDYAFNYCKENNLEYYYIGSVDADITFDGNYFESLMSEFEKNKNLGICSGHVGNIINNKIIWSNFRKDIPSGGARLWKKECFIDTEGYLLTCSPDSVSNVKATIRGWDIRQFEHIKMISTRAYASAEGQWKGYKKLGVNNYFIGYTPTHVLLKGIRMLYSTDGYSKNGVGLAYIIGYFSEYIKGAPRIKDDEILDYYKYKRLKEILCSKLKSRSVKK
ncbi:glycosyltransferase family 2 protein [Methanosarcina sp. WWM596]|uniref:glycosyltransferase family 2 protein n=1 Tax=Methanosarcina sp. WWM596 TaxID=1434103 RepID=UPI000615C501|nr:glycosyltransferase family 2 protein [Methanosarcina sp. WWM596]AKB17612.1 Glycosyltransferase [Methanosarcina sp. WWM596]